MLFQPCRGQAMVCTVVLSAAALASQTHYSYLNEFSAAPLVPPPISVARPRRVRVSTLAKKPRKSLYFCDNIPPSPCSLSSRGVPSARRAISQAFLLFISYFLLFFSFFLFHGSSFTVPLPLAPCPLALSRLTPCRGNKGRLLSRDEKSRNVC